MSAKQYGELHPTGGRDGPPRYRVCDYRDTVARSGQSIVHSTRDSASDVLLLSKGARVRVRPEHGSIWIAIGAGLHCNSATWDAWCSQGEACISDPRQEIEVSAPERHDSLVVGIVPCSQQLERASSRVSGPMSPTFVLFPEVAWHTGLDLSLVRQALKDWRRAPYSDETLGAWVDRILAACFEHQSSCHELVSRCSGRSLHQRQVMLCRLMRGRIAMQCQEGSSVEQGARAALLSSWRFIALHREVFGETPARSASQHRLDQALQQLSSGNLAVTEVAEIVGYRNRSSFSRAFKSRFGMPPAEAGAKLRGR